MDHSFATYLRAVGRGPKLSRSLSRIEACDAMGAILDGTVNPVQLGALLLLLRHRGETAEEVSGMVDAVHQRLPAAIKDLGVTLDWPSYADRHRQQPWFVLSALLLARNGARILMHGLSGAQDGFAPTRPALAQLDIPEVAHADELEEAFRVSNLVYLPVERYSAALAGLFDLRPLLGVRTVANSLARAVNPSAAPVQLQGVFHPNYRDTHREIAKLREQPRTAIFKGGGGEIQRNPYKNCEVAWLVEGEPIDETWSPMLPDGHFDWRSEDLSPERIRALWCGDLEHPQAEAAIMGTVAIAARALDWTQDQESSEALAAQLWRNRSASSSCVESATATIAPARAV